VSSSALVAALSSPHGSSLVSRLRSGSPLGLSVPPSSVFVSFSVPSASLLAGTDQLSSNFTTFVSDLARSASSLVGDDSTSSIFSSALPVSELPALPLVSSAPILFFLILLWGYLSFQLRSVVLLFCCLLRS
jgi:hypothetical protein